MSDIVRFSVSLEDDLLQQFDRYCEEEQYATRSEAIRQILRDTLTRRAWSAESHEAAGTLTLVYDHHRAQLRDRLMEVQHANTHLIVGTFHAHLSHELCLEVIILRGPAGELQRIASQLRGLKGIFKGELVMASAETQDQADPTDQAEDPGHDHRHDQTEEPGHDHPHDHHHDDDHVAHHGD
jgi:CopG family nickel-responsive transcriptional regulator